MKCFCFFFFIYFKAENDRALDVKVTLEKCWFAVLPLITLFVDTCRFIGDLSFLQINNPKGPNFKKNMPEIRIFFLGNEERNLK